MKFIKNGFTLVELLVVMGVLAVLASGLIIAINPLDKIKAANDTKVQNDISQIAGALAGYAASKAGEYPLTSQNPLTPGTGSILVTNGDLSVVPAPPTYAGYGAAYGYTGVAPCTATGCQDARVSGVLLSAKYSKAIPTILTQWVWCSSNAKAGAVIAGAANCMP